MRKLFTLLTLCALFVATAANAALNGLYTVGGTAPDYLTPAAAATALTAQGISGPVTFNIRPGTYTGKINLHSVTGASATNTITFQAENGDSTSVILSDVTGTTTTDNYLMLVYGADWVTFRQMTFQRTGSGTYGTVIRLDSVSIGVTIENSIISGPVTTATSSNISLIYSASGGISIDSITTIRNNILQNGSYGIFMSSANATFRVARNVIENNLITNCGNRGIHLENQRGIRVTGNTIESSGSTVQFIGIYATNNDRGMQISGNRIKAVSNGLCYGIQLLTNTAVTGQPGVIANNFISVISSSNSYGLVLSGVTGGLDIVYNSTNAGGTASSAAGIAFNSPVCSGVNLFNNIFMSPQVGISTASGMSAGIAASDYNDLFGGAAAGSYNGINAITLADWQTAAGLDSHSVSGDPQYTSVSDLHAASGVVNDLGTPYPGITTDIDGDLRSGTTPDIGADEFVPLADNVGPLAILAPKSTACGDSSVTVIATIRNFGGAAQTNIPVTIEVTGAATATLTATYTDTLLAGASDTLVFTQTLNTYTGGTFDFQFFTSLTGDQDNSNDTITASANFIAIPNPPTTTAFSYCPGSAVSSTTDSGFTTFWYAADTSSDPLYVGNDYAPSFTNDTTVWVEARQDGAGGCLRITEIAQDDPTVNGFSGDYIEIQNLSMLPFDATGWKVIVSDNGTTINTVNTTYWNLGVFQPGEIQWRTDNSTAGSLYWGANLVLNPNQNGWVAIIDQNGVVQDFVAYGWTVADIQGISATVAGFTITATGQWTGDGAVACGSGSAIARTGNTDDDDNSNWTCSPYTGSTLNQGLAMNFTGCGYGFCPSPRIPVQLSVLAAPSVNLGNDTSFSTAFSLTLDAGAGFASYLWSDSSTSQTLTATAAGSYAVVVTNANGCTATDSITINSTVGIPQVNTSDVSLYPNPASNQVTLRGLNASMGSYLVVVNDLQGREVLRRQGVGATGAQFIFDTAAWSEGTYVLHLSGEGFDCHRPLIITHR